MLAAALASAGGVGCEGSPRGRDARPPSHERTASISIRVEAPTQGGITASVIAFRAAVAGIDPAEVLGIVDPLAVGARSGGCEVRDLDASSRWLTSAGGSIELEELAGLEVELRAPAGLVLRPAARLYPDLGMLVGGVVTEAGPVGLQGLPDSVGIVATEPDRAEVDLPAPEAARIVSVGGGSVIPAAVSAGADLEVVVAPGPGTGLEIRPFGATAAVACGVASDGRVVVPRGLLLALAAGRTSGTLSIDAVRREERTVRLAGQPTHVLVEVRVSKVVELRP